MPATLDGKVGEITLTTLTGTKAASGDNELVASPGAGVRLVVTAFTIQNETVNTQTIQLRSGTSTNGWRILAVNRGDGLDKEFSTERPWELNANEALNLNLSAAQQCGYSVSYYTETV